MAQQVPSAINAPQLRGNSRSANAVPGVLGIQFLALVLLAVVIPTAEVVALSSGGPVRWADTLDVDIGITVYTGARLAMLLDAARPQYLTIVFFAFVYVWMGLAAVAQAASQTWPWAIVLSPGVQLQGALLVATGVAAYDVGRLVSRFAGNVTTAVPKAVWRLSARRTVALGWIVVITFPIAVSSLGGLAAQFQNRDAASAALFPAGVVNGVVQQQVLAGALARDGWTGLAFVAIYALTLLMRERRRAHLAPRTSYRVLLVCLVAVNVVINSPFANPRYWVGTVVIALLLSLPVALRYPGKVAFVACILVGTAVIFPYGNVFRSATAYQSAQSTNVLNAFQSSADYDASFMVEATVQYVAVHGFSAGEQLLGTATFWMPRQIWSSKPTDTGFLLGYFLGTGTPNVSAPIWAEGFIDFGWAGTIGYLLILGCGSALLDRRWGARVGPLDRGRIMLPLLAGYSIIVLRGSLLQAMGSLTVFCLLLWLLCEKGGVDTVNAVPDAAILTSTNATLGRAS